MFDKSKPRYLTKGVDESIPLDIQILMWEAVDGMSEPKDYLQRLKFTQQTTAKAVPFMLKLWLLFLIFIRFYAGFSHMWINFILNFFVIL